MLATRFWQISLIAAAGFAAAPFAAAQHVVLDAPGFMQTKAAPPPPAVRAQPTVWPRLDPGAVFCRTADDLERHAYNMTARVSGGGTMAADCRIIPQPTGIQIVNRHGLGRTEVKMNGGDNAVGWTDAWLPEKAPPGR